MPSGDIASPGLANPSGQLELETLSASVNLEDIIQDYDSTGDSDSLVSLSNSKPQYSQTYFSADGTNDQETTSFHTALQDGFSISEYDSNNHRAQCNQDLLWGPDDTSVRGELLQPSNFQVFWSDLIYRIEPKITLGSVWRECERVCKASLSSIFRSINCRHPIERFGCENSSVKRLRDREPLTIIQQISGSFKSGELTAVMGPSGAGKTSLLNFLSRRQELGYTGELYVHNSHRRIKISTIPQKDYLPEYLTVGENLMFASRLKNPVPSYDHERNIEKVSSLLGLDDCLFTRTKKISGGQHKRLSIAQELLSKPDILILDEPTSGLDSLTCYKTLSVLKNLVKSSGRMMDPIAIVVTIHQPQQEVFDIFDKIYVMANGGVAIYDGPPANCTQFIKKYAGIHMPDEDYNPASFLIEIASGEYGAEPIKALEAQVELEFSSNRRECKFQKVSFKKSTSFQAKNTAKFDCSGEKQSDEGRRNNEVLNRAKPRCKPLLYIDQRIAKGSSMNRGNFWLKTRILAERYWISITRDPKQLIARILFHIFLPICLAFTLGTEPGSANACPKFESEYQLRDLVNDTKGDEHQTELLLTLENIALLFVLIYAISSANIAAVTLSFTQDMQSSLKEFHNGWYSMPSYITARLLTDTPVEIFLPILTLSIAYPLSGQSPVYGMPIAYRVLITALAMILGSMIGQSLGMIFGAIYVGHVSTALFASQGATLPLLFFSGFMARTKYMSKLVYALSELSMYRHILEVAVVARYGFNVCPCDPNTITGQDPRLVGVPEQLKSLTQFWILNSEPDSGLDESNPIVSNTNLSTLKADDVSEAGDDDIFQMFAKQVSLYNTYGVKINSCKDVTPYQLSYLSLDESDMLTAFLALVILLLSIRLLLLLTVKLVIHFKTSL